MSGNMGLKRKDTTRGPPLRILSLDGGGVRGYSMLILLQELMHRLFSEAEGRAPKRHEIPKPCDYFDLIGGTGTGGLIAIMIGRLRLDLETCKEVYIRMTRKVFETDKTIFGMPYRSSLFKASKLEEAIKECVREHTIYTDEGNDGTPTGGRPLDRVDSVAGGRETPASPNGSRMESRMESDRRTSFASSDGSGARSPSNLYHAGMRWGNAGASLYDAREGRTKTAVTAVYKDTDPKNGGPILLRSYDSRKEPPPEFNCTIWQAGRATSAIGLSFKPIRIGTSTFVDEGAGKYNPAPQIMDEAVLNEWPGREVGVFVSIGTGKRPGGTNNRQSEWWEGFIGGNLGDFAEFRRKLIGKIEECEETHRYMMSEHLSRRGVNAENYYRINVEVGVGDFGMNEWSRVADISTSTRLYLAKPDVKQMMENAAGKMARIERAKRRYSTMGATAASVDGEVHPALRQQRVPSPTNPLAAELPGDDGKDFWGGARAPLRHSSLAMPEEKFSVLSPHDIPQQGGNRRSSDYRHGWDDWRSSSGSFIPSPLMPSPRRSHENQSQQWHDAVSNQSSHQMPPPRPPKTPIQPPTMSGVYPGPAHPHPGQPISPQQMVQRESVASSIASSLVSPMRASGPLPYPDDDGPPPVNMERKPHFVQR